MARFDTRLNENLREFIARQHIFFTASAPDQGRINLSPKGLDSFRVLSDTRVGYLEPDRQRERNRRPRGPEWPAFEGKPLIVRLYGQGSVVRPQDEAFASLRESFPTYPGERQIVLLEIESIMSTCGFAVPFFEYKGERDNLLEFSCNMGSEKMDAYRHERNQKSIDGLPTYLFEDRSA